MLTTGRADADHFHEECGVFGIYGHPDAAALTALGLHALQHRGQEAAGIVAYDGGQFNAHRGPGLVGDNFSSKDVIDRLPGSTAIGHVRYATTGEVALRNVQPLFADFEFGGLAICHNGNLTNSYQLRRQLVRRGSLFQSTSDTEVIVHLIATSLKDTVVDRLTDALRQVQGAYSLAAISQDEVIGVRDPLGVRPLVLGRLGDAWILSSETCALDIIGADFVREVEPGEIVMIDGRGPRSVKPFAKVKQRPCIFEWIYFARPDSIMEGISFYGIATPERDKLLAARFDVAAMAQFIGVDTLSFISIDGLYRAMGTPGRDPAAPRFCDACFTGDYPIPLIDHDAGRVSTQLSLLAETA